MRTKLLGTLLALLLSLFGATAVATAQDDGDTNSGRVTAQQDGGDEEDDDSGLLGLIGLAGLLGLAGLARRDRRDHSDRR